jgi:hypothetical protein
VVADQGVIDSRLASDVANVEVGVADLDEPVARRAQDRRARRRAVGSPADAPRGSAGALAGAAGAASGSARDVLAGRRVD